MGFLLITIGVFTFTGCGSSGAATGLVPQTPQQSHARHVLDCSQFDAAGNCVVTPPAESPCDSLNPGNNCFGDPIPPGPNLNSPYIDQFGMACNPLSPKVTGGTLQVCSMNPAYDATGALEQLVHHGPPMPQCGMLYGVMNVSAFHQCYKGFVWVN